ncbi:MAG: hypothetical protein SGARI_008099 [Bacillariaceae sp.]
MMMRKLCLTGRDVLLYAEEKGEFLDRWEIERDRIARTFNVFGRDTGVGRIGKEFEVQYNVEGYKTMSRKEFQQLHYFEVLLPKLDDPY